MTKMSNLDRSVVEAFGQEWSKFDHSDASTGELQVIFNDYFSIFPWKDMPPNAVGFDLGCGSGRWARFVAPRVRRLHCIDASAAALDVARRNLSDCANCSFHCASVESIPLPDSSADFGYSLGVLHHVPDTQEGIRQCVRKLKPGGPLLLYLYYAFDNRPWWYRQLWHASDLVRLLVSKLPFALKSLFCDVTALVVYWPLARLARILETLGMNVASLPLSAYRSRSFYAMRTDALDRFGTRLEKRFTREQMRQMMEQAGLRKITFSETIFWCAVGWRGEC